MKEFKRSDIVLLIIVVILIVTYFFIKLFSIKSEPLLLDYASLKSENIITIMINNSINKELYNKEYNHIINVEKDNNGNIVNLELNNSITNKILYNMTNVILDDIYDLENGNYDNLLSKNISSNNSIYYVPYGIIYNSSVLSNIGPKIPFKIDFLSGINSNIETNIRDYGINSYIVEVVLNIDLQVQVIMPFKSNSVEINKSIILDSMIIQGQIPRYYSSLK